MDSTLDINDIAASSLQVKKLVAELIPKSMSKEIKSVTSANPDKPSNYILKTVRKGSSTFKGYFYIVIL